jgi:hypothetical protein
LILPHKGGGDAAERSLRKLNSKRLESHAAKAPGKKRNDIVLTSRLALVTVFQNSTARPSSRGLSLALAMTRSGKGVKPLKTNNPAKCLDFVPE